MKHFCYKNVNYILKFYSNCWKSIYINYDCQIINVATRDINNFFLGGGGGGVNENYVGVRTEEVNFLERITIT